MQLEKGDILGHEFCGVVDSMGPAVKGLKKGDRVVASFQIACGDVSTLSCMLLLGLELLIHYFSVSFVSRSSLLNARRRIRIPWRMECMEEEQLECLAILISLVDL